MNPIERMRLESNVFTFKSKLETKTSRGMLSKGWYEGRDKCMYLVKGNNDEKGYEPHSEVLVSILLDILDIPHVEYTLGLAKDFPEIQVYDKYEYVSICKTYVDDSIIENVQFSKYMDAKAKESRVNRIYDYWTYFMRLEEDMIKDIFLILYIDALVGNQDRHLNNWDMIKYSDGNWKVAPMFDFGASLLSWVDNSKLTGLKGIRPDKSKPFKETHMEQIKLITRSGFKGFDINTDEVYKEWLYRSEDVLDTLNNNRRKAIETYLYNRLEVYGDVRNSVER